MTFKIRFNLQKLEKILLWALLFSCIDQANAQCLKNNQFDYIVVGSGSAGATIANRLSETSNVRVLLVEAGVEPLYVSTVPLLASEALNTIMDWNFTSVPQLSCCQALKNSEAAISRGKALGGSSSINFMITTRGFKEDYDNWKNQGNEGWGWKDILPYALKQEDYQGPIPNPENEPYHHKGGPMTVEFPTYRSKSATAFMDAAAELGYPTNIDYNGDPKNQIGFMYPPFNTRNHSRCSTYVAYIKPALKRKNFVLEKGSLVTKILIDNNKVATGIEYLKKGKTCKASASREVIVSSGTVGSPKLLMLSGIGPEFHLLSKGIEVVHNLPGVGENYQDHVGLGGVQYFLNKNVTTNNVRYATPEYLAEWQYNRTGPMQIPVHVEGIGFLTSTNANSTTWPDIELGFFSDNTGSLLKMYLREILYPLLPSDDQEVITLMPIISRGSITLASKDPQDKPFIDTRMLTDLQDIDTFRQVIQIADKMINTKAFKKYGAASATFELATTCKSIVGDGPLEKWLTNFNWLTCAIPILSTGVFHPVETCKMGPSTDPMAVVDNKLRVHGIQHLRVADASIMPTAVAAHTNIPTITIGEKISDVIKSDHGDPTDPLPPLPPNVSNNKYVIVYTME